MKTLCLGGSFNPIHHGHLICARAAAENAGFDRILLIPSRQPPHKPDNPDLAAPQHRLRMCQLAIASSSRFDASDIELFREGPSYTIDTAQQLRGLPGHDEVSWLIGADMLNSLPTWHRPVELLELVNFVVVLRPGHAFDWLKLPAAYRKLESSVVPVPQIEISATDIRRRVRGGLPIDYLTPPTVADYIAHQLLFR